MELHGEDGAILVLETFHQSVIRPSRRHQPFAQDSDSLMMITVHLQALCLDRAEKKASLLNCDLVKTRLQLSVGAQPVWHVRAELRRQVLEQGALE